ncbi:MAG: hypothetical protein QOG03_658 [Actinomycetota bacterium]|nr:hypothetical protein [Actinomycetota bacterium]
MRPRSLIAASVAALCGLLAFAPIARAGNDYSDPEYARHDADNVSRSSERQFGEFTSPEYGSAFQFTAAETWLTAQANQINDLRSGRLHGGLGQLLPGGAVGDPRQYHALTPIRIQFLSRTGAKLSGRIWGADGTAKPGVVITTGSIQGTEHMYWWAARTLVARGYEVMTWDVQGQGESESTGHAFGDTTPNGDGVPSQQNGNFYQGTIDALRFFASTPGQPYVPGTRTAADVDAAKTTAATTGEHLDWVNPGWAAYDHSRLGIAGHSLGAGAVSAVQACSDAKDYWKTLALCEGQSFPIKAVIGWDALGGGAGVQPAVPGLNEQADGYFLNPTPAPNAPDANSHLAAHNAWKAAGLDTFSLTIRGGTHLEWTQIPWILPATNYGTKLADYYSALWFDRYVKGDPSATQQMIDGLTATGANGDLNVAWNTHHFSTRYKSAYSLAGFGEVIDLRAASGLSPVGDWAGSNADPVGAAGPDMVGNAS